MAKKVLIENPNSIYRDKPGIHYHFPKLYLSRMNEAVRDWVLFYESKPTLEYKAVGKVDTIIPAEEENHFLALIDRTTYLQFPSAVPFRLNGEVLNTSLLNDKGKISGRAQSAVRPINDDDFLRIVNLGLKEVDLELPRESKAESDELYVLEEQADYNYDRDTVRVTLNQKVRNAAFRKNVLNAYDKTCAFSGLSFINGGGRAEVQAAHIYPVEFGGNDSVRNGIALCGTAHWMFDRGMLSLQDDGQILISRHINDLESVERLLRPSRKALLPDSPNLRPHPDYLKWHRDERFKT